MRPARSHLALLLATALLAVPATAAAQSSPFQPLPAPQADQSAAQTQTVATPVTSSSSSSGGLGTSGVILLFIGGVLVLGGIVFGIWWDARRRAPALASDGLYEEPNASPHQKKSQARARAKRARAARKRNRKR